MATKRGPTCRQASEKGALLRAGGADPYGYFLQYCVGFLAVPREPRSMTIETQPDAVASAQANVQTNKQTDARACDGHAEATVDPPVDALRRRRLRRPAGKE